ncbi:MAG: NADAR family protein [Bdellovibrionaceae bacterium]|nr:NADAR family protein [Pseudobdellovibrionaceae bacterium]
MNFFLVSFTLFFSLFSFAANSEYPEHWWKPVSELKPPSWEILPQAADKEKNEVILSKRNELGLLSNFAPTPFTMLGKKYASLEGLWQSMKLPEDIITDPRRTKQLNWPSKRSEVENQTAFEALRSGKAAEKIMLTHGIYWVSFNGWKMEYKGKDAAPFYDIIEAATRAKADQNAEVKKILLATGNLKLRPDHHEDKDATPAYRYYDIYMKLRSELQKNPDAQLYKDDWYTIFQKNHKLEKIK